MSEISLSEFEDTSGLVTTEPAESSDASPTSGAASSLPTSSASSTSHFGGGHRFLDDDVARARERDAAPVCFPFNHELSRHGLSPRSDTFHKDFQGFHMRANVEVAREKNLGGAAGNPGAGGWPRAHC